MVQKVIPHSVCVCHRRSEPATRPLSLSRPQRVGQAGKVRKCSTVGKKEGLGRQITGELTVHYLSMYVVCRGFISRANANWVISVGPSMNHNGSPHVIFVNPVQVALLQTLICTNAYHPSCLQRGGQDGSVDIPRVAMCLLLRMKCFEDI